MQEMPFCRSRPARTRIGSGSSVSERPLLTRQSWVVPVQRWKRLRLRPLTVCVVTLRRGLTMCPFYVSSTTDRLPIGPTKFISEELTTSTRPDLSSASRVVSGGRALKSAEQFTAVMEPLADSLGAGKVFNEGRSRSYANGCAQQLSALLEQPSMRVMRTTLCKWVRQERYVHLALICLHTRCAYSSACFR